MAGTVEDVRDENYKEFTDSPGAVVAYGLATCEPCKTYDPILEETAAKFPNIKIGKAKMHVPGHMSYLLTCNASCLPQMILNR